jgi:short-subunit dehydrogenase
VPATESASGPAPIGARSGKVALVTGASAGLGRAFAAAFAARGDDVVLVARDQARLDVVAAALRAEHGVNAEVLPADLTADDGRAAVAARLAADDRPVDVLVNNAGVMTVGNFADSDVAREMTEVELNVAALVSLTHAAAVAMTRRRRGAIVNVSSLAGFAPVPHSATYGATKAFVNSFSHAVADDLRGTGVRVLLVCPGFTHTELHARAGLGPTRLPEVVWQQPEEVVATALAHLDRGRMLSVPGVLNAATAAAASVSPAGVSRRVARLFARRTG